MSLGFCSQNSGLPVAVPVAVNFQRSDEVFRVHGINGLNPQALLRGLQQHGDLPPEAAGRFSPSGFAWEGGGSYQA